MLGDYLTGVPVDPSPFGPEQIAKLAGKYSDNAEQVRMDRDQRMYISGFVACAQLVAAGKLSFEKYTHEDGSSGIRFVEVQP